MLDEKIGVGDAAANIVVLVPPHDEEVGQRQDGNRHPCIRQAARQGCDLARRHRREFGHVAAAAVLLGQLADEMNVHCLRRVADIEVDVDLHVELAGELKDPSDLTGMVGVISRRAADSPGAAFQRLYQQLVGAGIVGEPVLRKDADFDIDGPAVIGDQRLHPFEPAHSDGGVDFDLGAHPRRAVEDAFGQSTLRPGANILDGKAAFQRRDLLHRVDPAPGFGRRAVDDAGFIELDVSLDQPAAGQPPAGIVSLRLRRQTLLDGDNLPARNTDIHRLPRAAVWEPNVAYNQVHTLVP